MTAAMALDRARAKACALVTYAERSTGSKMNAYGWVARQIGVSSSWVRKLIGRQAGLELEAHEYLNLATLYARTCERLERDAQSERRAWLALIGDSDAANPSHPEISVMATDPARPADPILVAKAGD